MVSTIKKRVIKFAEDVGTAAFISPRNDVHPVDLDALQKLEHLVGIIPKINEIVKEIK